MSQPAKSATGQPDSARRARAAAALLCAALAAFLGTARPALAAVVNPDLSSYGSDDGGQVFVQASDGVVSLKIVDVEGSTSFGIFQDSAPDNFAILLGPADPDGYATFTNIQTGIVFNNDASFRTTFAPFTSPFGFFAYSGTTGAIIATDDAQNPGALRFAAAFPSLTLPDTYLIGFDTAASGAEQPVGYILVSGVTVVDEPDSLLLLAAGLAVVAAGRRRTVR